MRSSRTVRDRTIHQLRHSGGPATAATRNLKIATSSNGTTFTTVANPRFAASQTHQLNTVAPSTKPKKVKFLRVTMQGSQSTSGAGRQYMGLGEVVMYGRPSDLVAPVISGVTIPAARRSGRSAAPPASRSGPT